MLILTRKEGEQIRIGEDILVTVLDISRSGVKLGIKAPKDVSIYRHEVYERIMNENVRASQGAVSDLERIADIWQEIQGKE